MKEKEVKEIVQEVEIKLNDINKAKLKSLKIFENQYLQYILKSFLIFQAF